MNISVIGDNVKLSGDAVKPEKKNKDEYKAAKLTVTA